MQKAFDTLLQIQVSAENAAANSDNEMFRYECLCCGEEVFLAAQNSKVMSTHFRHRSGNNDKSCDWYLGHYGAISSSALNGKKRQNRVEFYYDNTKKVFCISFRFNEDEINLYEENDTAIEVRTIRSAQPFISTKINHSNFCDDVAERYILDRYSESYFISNTLNNIKREYCVFSGQRPTFFKIQEGYTDFIAKNIKSNSVYTNTKYFVAWPGQNTAQIYFKKVNGVKIESQSQFKAMGNTTIWAQVVTFTEKNIDLYNLLRSWGYELSVSEEITLLWPPSYTNNGVININSNTLYIFSTFSLLAHGNTNAPYSSLKKIDSKTTKITFKDIPTYKLRILKNNAEMTAEYSEYYSYRIPTDIEYVYRKRFKVPSEGLFYYYSNHGIELLSPGKIVYLTKSSYIVELIGNYISKIIAFDADKDISIQEKIQEAISYYWVSTPIDSSLNIQQKDKEKELKKYQTNGFINAAVKAIIEEHDYE